MEPVSLQEIYKNYPQLEDIAIRLEVSKKEADEKNAERKTGKITPREENPAQQQRRVMTAPCDHARITKFFSAGNWQDTYHVLQPGRKPFEDNLLRIMMRNPDSIEIQINSSSKLSTISKPQIIQLNFNKEVNVPASKDPAEESAVTKQILEQLSGLQNAIQAQPKLDSSNISENIMQLNFAQQLKEIQHTNLVENLKRDHRFEKDALTREYEKQIDDLTEEIDALNEEIEELEAEKLETEEHLSGIDKSIEIAKNPPFYEMLGKIGAKAAEHFVKENADGIAKFLKIPEEDIKEYFAGKEEAEKAGTKTHNESSFSEVATSNPYTEIPEEKKKYADAFLNVTQGLNVEDLQVLVSTIQLALNEDGSINKKILGEMYKAGKEPVNSDNL